MSKSKYSVGQEVEAPENNCACTRGTITKVDGELIEIKWDNAFEFTLEYRASELSEMGISAR